MWVLDPELFPSATLAGFYRFAVLLTGQPQHAEKLLAELLVSCEGRLGDIRDGTHRALWFAARLRQKCLDNQPSDPRPPKLVRTGADGEQEILPLEAYILAQHFQALPEPQRSGLALFYLGLFTPEQIAKTLGISLETLGGALRSGRARLGQSLWQTPSDS